MSAFVECCLKRRAQALAALFVAFGLSGCLAIAVLTPPYANLDEAAHFFRADAISLGGLIGERRDHLPSGGTVDTSIYRNAREFWPMPRLDRLAIDEVFSFEWDGKTHYLPFETTAINPPTSYLPAVVGIWLGKWLRLDVATTLALARCLDALAYVAIGAVSIAISEAAAPMLFTLLLLPTAMNQAAAVTHDGWLLAWSAVAASLAARGLRREEPGARRKHALLLSGALAMIVVDRPPYLPLAVIPLLLPLSLRFRVTASATIGALCLLWVASMLAFVATPFPTAIGAAPPNATRQLQLLLHDPGDIGLVILRTLAASASDMYLQFIGWSGWLLPSGFYSIATVVMALSALLSAGTAERSAGRRDRAVVASAILLAAALVVVAAYVTWTSPGSRTAWGVQGRYLLPLAMFLPVALPEMKPCRRALQCVMLTTVALFPAAGITAVLHAIVQHFYVGN